jgi:hypothetical protein
MTSRSRIGSAQKSGITHHRSNVLSVEAANSAGGVCNGTADVAECAGCLCVSRIITVSTMSVTIRINLWFMFSSFSLGCRALIGRPAIPKTDDLPACRNALAGSFPCGSLRISYDAGNLSNACAKNRSTTERFKNVKIGKSRLSQLRF